MKISPFFDAKKDSKSFINFELAEISDQRTSLRTVEVTGFQNFGDKAVSVLKEAENNAVSGTNLENNLN